MKTIAKLIGYLALPLVISNSFADTIEMSAYLNWQTFKISSPDNNALLEITTSENTGINTQQEGGIPKVITSNDWTSDLMLGTTGGYSTATAEANTNSLETSVSVFNSPEGLMYNTTSYASRDTRFFNPGSDTYVTVSVDYRLDSTVGILPDHRIRDVAAAAYLSLVSAVDNETSKVQLASNFWNGDAAGVQELSGTLQATIFVPAGTYLNIYSDQTAQIETPIPASFSLFLTGLICLKAYFRNRISVS